LTDATSKLICGFGVADCCAQAIPADIINTIAFRKSYHLSSNHLAMVLTTNFAG